MEAFKKIKKKKTNKKGRPRKSTVTILAEHDHSSIYPLRTVQEKPR